VAASISSLLSGFCQRIREETHNRLALVGASAAVARVQVAALFKLIELGAADEKRPREQSAFLRAVGAHTVARRRPCDGVTSSHQCSCARWLRMRSRDDDPCVSGDDDVTP
jgi:hypothetical protein